VSAALVFREAAVDRLLTVLGESRRQVREQLAEATRRSDGLMGEWSVETPSRQAERAHRDELDRSVVEALDLLERIERAVAQLRQLGRETELRVMVAMRA